MLTHFPPPPQRPSQESLENLQEFIHLAIFAKDLESARHWEYSNEHNSHDGETDK